MEHSWKDTCTKATDTITIITTFPLYHKLSKKNKCTQTTGIINIIVIIPGKAPNNQMKSKTSSLPPTHQKVFSSASHPR